ncbi:M35 family metallo-endopeptidase [Chitinophaga sp.]|uniref:M35 family metallo-endopeptidase n=1 Tax=Chitinophaga sp. TaxID=1869181 RepID=UPI0031D69C94
MNTHIITTQENKSQSIANTAEKKPAGNAPSFQLADNRPETTLQRKLQEMADNSPQVSRQGTFQHMADTQQKTIQRVHVNAVGQTKISAKLEEAFDSAENDLKTGIENIDAYGERIQQYFHGNDLQKVKGSLIAMLEMLQFIKARPVPVNTALPEATERDLVGYRELNQGNKDGGAYTEGLGDTALITFLPTALTYNNFNLAMTIIHEIAHATPGVKAEDIAYGQHRFFEFINEFPGMAIKNADSFAFAVAALNGQDLKDSRAQDNIEGVTHNFGGNFFKEGEEGIPPIIPKVIKTMAYAEQMWNQSVYQLLFAQAELNSVKENPIKKNATRLYKHLPFKTDDINEQEQLLKAILEMGLAAAEVISNAAFYSRETGGQFAVKKGIKTDRLIIGDLFDQQPQPRQLFIELSGKSKTEVLKFWKIFVYLSGKDLIA